MFGVALSDLLTVGLYHAPVSLFIVDEVSFFLGGEAGWGDKVVSRCSCVLLSSFLEA